MSSTLPVLSSDNRLQRNRLLDQIEIAAPCPAKWEEMRGDDAQRFCGGCQKSVYNLAGMSSLEAEKLIFETEGNLCVRLFRRHDGTVITSDCPVGLAERAWRRARNTALASVSLIIVLLTGALVALFGASRTTTLVETTDGIQETIEDLRQPEPPPLAGAPMPIDVSQFEMGEMVDIPEPVPAPKASTPKMGRLKVVK